MIKISPWIIRKTYKDKSIELFNTIMDFMNTLFVVIRCIVSTKASRPSSKKRLKDKRRFSLIHSVT